MAGYIRIFTCLLMLSVTVGCFVLVGAFGDHSEWREMNGTQYYITEYSNEVYDWYSAREFCMERGGDLASFHSQAEMDQVMEWSEEHPYFNYNFWIGFNDLERTGYQWTDKSPIDYQHWALSYPETEKNHGRFCAYCIPRTTGEWRNDHCAKQNGFVCRRPVTSSSPTPKTDPTTKSPLGYCPRGYVDAGTKCFKTVPLLEKNGVTFEEAVVRCREEQGRLPDIASIHNIYENAIITAQMQKSMPVGMWIGLYREGSDWYWADNSLFDFTYWENRVPDRYGGGVAEMVYRHPPMGHTGMWNNTRRQPDDRRGYVCQTFKDPASSISTPPSTTTNVCPGHSVPYNKGCYRLVTEVKTWVEANKTCEEDGASLVSIHSEPENAFLFALVQRGNVADVWTGLHDPKGSGEYQWTDGWYVMYTRWETNQPKPGQGGGCVVMSEGGKWRDETCSTPKAFVCKTTTAPSLTTPIHAEGKCPKEGGEWKGWGDYCYLFSDTRGVWFTAQEACVKKYVHAQLVSIHDAVDNDWIYQNMKSQDPWSGAWIGLYRGKNDGEFKWVDQTTLQYDHWRPGSPEDADSENHCVSMGMTDGVFPGMWQDVGCDQYLVYICKTLKRPVVTTPPDLPGRCPDAEWAGYGADCYLFEPDLFASWDTAKEQCQRRQANLSSIVAEHEADFVHAEMVKKSQLPTPRNYWLGGSKVGAGGSFRWLDGLDVAYDGWARDYPTSDPNGNLNCIQVDPGSGFWQNTDCSMLRGFVCKVKKVLSDTTSATTPTSTTQTSHTTSSSQMTSSTQMTSTTQTTSEEAPSPTYPGPSKDTSAVVAAVILGVILAIVLVAHLLHCYLASKRAPKTLAGFINPFYAHPNSGPAYAAWSSEGSSVHTKTAGDV